MLVLFAKGLIAGFSIAAPVGPIGILCIQRSLQDGFKIGLMTGLGAACADGLYGLIAGFGLTSVSSLFMTHQNWIRFIGGTLLLYLGVRLFRTIPPDQSMKNPDELPARRSSWYTFSATFLLTLTNPITILLFIAVFSGLELNTTSANYAEATVLSMGIVLGATAWWLLLSSGVSFIFRRRLSVTAMRRINQFSGIVLLAFGIFVLAIR
ncbi:MAG: LysE family translocator [Alphaproteobacteria bacterium]|nr:LysE family translocator [Alphaproteobacteria bacterium]